MKKIQVTHCSFIKTLLRVDKSGKMQAGLKRNFLPKTMAGSDA